MQDSHSTSERHRACTGPGLLACAGALLSGLLGACGGPEPSPADDADGGEHRFDVAIGAEDLDAHTRTLASDAFGGRPPSGPFADKTVDYLTGHFERLGLEPAFGDSYLQPVPLVSITASPTAALAVSGDDGTETYRYGDEMMVWTTRVVEKVALDDSEIVFVGYGIDAPEAGWNDYAGVDMQGKTALMLINDPGFATQDPDLFSGNRMTYYGRWTYKYEEAARQGASGAIIIHETDAATYGWSVVENSWTGAQFDLVRDDRNLSRVAVEGWVQRETGAEILARAGFDLDELKALAVQEGFSAVPLGLTASIAIENALAESSTVNIAATLRGSQRPDEHVIYSAHWDHLGIGPEIDGDGIYNGAVDNAAGVAAVLEVAEKMAGQPPPARSVTFFLTGAEEQGLLGSYHYTENPPYPLASTAALINTDVLLPLGRMKDVTVIGPGSSELETYLEAAAAEQGRDVTAYANPEQGFYFRSDHFPFAKKGVPALYLHTGTEHVDKGTEYVTQAKADYVTNVYHTPFDEWQPDWDWSGVTLDVELRYAIGWALANTPDWPEWYAGVPFKAVREQSRGAGAGTKAEEADR